MRVLDGFTPVGRGQRIGVFAGSGVGKSSLLSMITRNNEATVTVIALVGERGREVRQFVEDDLGPEGLARSVVVVSTSDDPPLLRLRAAFAATRIAEGFAAEGADVVLLMDSLTRVATAQREVALSAGEPPATRGFPPSVFAMMPRLLERAGPLATGTITGVYTVLVDGDDHNEPIADAVRGVLDGHVVLSRAIATAGRFPSVDVLASVSRLAPHISTAEELQAASRVRRMMAAHRDARDLVEVGAYVPGSNADVDAALRLQGPDRAVLHPGPGRAGAPWPTPSAACGAIADAAGAVVSLAALLGLRRTARREAEREVATAVAARARAQQARAQVVGRLQGDPYLLESGGDPRLALARRAGLLGDLSRADDAVVSAMSVEQQHQQLVAQARMRLKAVERLEERRNEEQRRLREQQEAAELDDVVASLRRHREGRR